MNGGLNRHNAFTEYTFYYINHQCAWHRNGEIRRVMRHPATVNGIGGRCMAGCRLSCRTVLLDDSCPAPYALLIESLCP